MERNSMIKLIKEPKTTYVKRVVEYTLDIDGKELTLIEESDDNGAEIQYLHPNKPHDTWSVYPPAWVEDWFEQLEGTDFGVYEDFEELFRDNLFEMEEGIEL